MTKLSAVLTFLVLLVAGNSGGMANDGLEQVITEGKRIRLDYDEDFQNGRCRIVMKPRGSLVVLKGNTENPPKKLMWQTGIAPGHTDGDDYVLQLREKGNMVIKRILPPGSASETETVYDTHTDGDVGEYFLGIKRGCVLQIRKGSLQNPGDLVWTNIITEMSSGDSLGTSEIFSWYGNCYDHFMFMNPSGNLEIYKGRDFTDAGNQSPVWETNTKRTRGDYRFEIGDNGVISLRDVGTDVIYWEKDMKNSGGPPSEIFDLSLVSFGCENYDDVVGPSAWFAAEKNIVMRQGDKIPAGSAYMSGHNCVVFVQYDGRIDIDDSYNLIWASGKARNDEPSDEYFLTLTKRGNLIMYRGTVSDPIKPLWATHTVGEIGDYFLITTPRCDLRVFQGTPTNRGELVWSNRVFKLQSGNRLTKGQYFSPQSGSCGAVMYLRPDNGELAIYDGSECFESIYQYPSCFDYPLWKYDAGLEEYDDSYVKVGYNGKLQFYGVGENGDELKGEYEFGDSGGDFEVALCDGDVFGPTAV